MGLRASPGDPSPAASQLVGPSLVGRHRRRPACRRTPIDSRPAPFLRGPAAASSSCAPCRSIATRLERRPGQVVEEHRRRHLRRWYSAPDSGSWPRASRTSALIPSKPLRRSAGRRYAKTGNRPCAPIMTTGSPTPPGRRPTGLRPAHRGRARPRYHRGLQLRPRRVHRHKQRRERGL